MIEAIGANPSVVQATAQRQAAQSGANFQSYLSPAPGGATANGLVVGKLGPGGLIANLPIGFSAEDTEALQRSLTQAFHAAGIDTSQPIDLGTDAEGNVVVKDDNPQKAAIEKVFKDHPALAGLYRKVAAEDSWQALGWVAGSYTHDYEQAVGSAAQTAIFGKYEPIFQQIQRLGSDLTFAGGTVTSAAVTYADGLFPERSVGYRGNPNGRG